LVSGLFVAPPVGLEPKMVGDIPRKIPIFGSTREHAQKADYAKLEEKV